MKVRFYSLTGGRLASALNVSKSVAESGSPESLRKHSAAMVVGAATMMEGGALGPYTRQQIETFCQERLIGPFQGNVHNECCC